MLLCTMGISKVRKYRALRIRKVPDDELIVLVLKRQYQKHSRWLGCDVGPGGKGNVDFVFVDFHLDLYYNESLGTASDVLVL